MCFFKYFFNNENNPFFFFTNNLFFHISKIYFFHCFSYAKFDIFYLCRVKLFLQNAATTSQQYQNINTQPEPGYVNVAPKPLYEEIKK